ncbi:MAG: tRNA pseudouridine(55) synthase TruB [Gemmatimonadetes bacterium]|nr:tRNA pseudouridine(55) synthase TruB [Gemmatimonadota bacterium]
MLVDKPAGPTSHDVVDVVRRAIGVRRVGHTGTLDPFASGLLVMVVGRATRLARYLVHQRKRYTGIVRLGTTTDSDDRTGEVTATSEAWTGLTQDDVHRAMAALVGAGRQRPPAFSAKKIGGRRAYELARAGQAIPLADVEVEILSFSFTSMDGPDVGFDVLVSGGTYIRSLARDLGTRLGCGAHLAELRRTELGRFAVRDACPADAVVPRAVRPPRELVQHLDAVAVGEAERDLLRHGRAITVEATLSGTVAITSGEELLAIAEAHGHELTPRVVLAT